MGHFLITILIISILQPTSSLSVSSPAKTIPDAQKAVFDILSSQSYSKAVRPTIGNGTNATQINVNMFIRKIERIDDLKVKHS